MAGEYVFNVGTNDFIELVIEKSRDVPVLVDFWAEWCAPCRMLGPVLERIVEKLGGKVLLAKLDVDQNKELAQRFKVSGIPAVKLFIDGKIAGGFTGAMPEEQVLAFLNKYLPSEGDKSFEQAEELRKAGRLDEAEKMLKQILEKEPGRSDILESLVKVELLEWKIDDAEKTIEGIEVPDKSIELLRDGLDFWREAASIEPDWKPSEDDSKLETFLKAAEYHAKDSHYSDAMENLLEIVKRDKTYRNGIAKRALVFLFVLLGFEDPAVKEYQTLLPRWLY